MIITRTPFRISFFGGGTDYPAYYREQPGSVLAATINKYCYITLRRLAPLFDYKYRVVYSKTELAREIREITHPSVRGCLHYLDIREGLEIFYSGDLPARTGIGSSSSFTVGMLNALYAHKAMRISNLELAESAIYVEQEVINENVGSQDQTMAAFGGFNIVRFSQNPDDHIRVAPLCIDRRRINSLQDNLMLFFTGLNRKASEIAGELIKQIPNRKQELKKMYSMVDEAEDILLKSNNLEDFGCLLHETWQIKKELTDKISVPLIDDIYQKAMQAGAIGGKILGAGSGGFILFYVKPDDQTSVKRALNLPYVPFNFEYSGSQVIYRE